MPIVVVANQKGGVGKSTFAINLSKGLSDRGKKVLAVDNDPQGDLTGAFLDLEKDPDLLNANLQDIYDEKLVVPQKISNNLDLLGAHIGLASVQERDFKALFCLKMGLRSLEKSYDFVIVDCLPTFGAMQTAALNAADFVLIPTKPAPFSVLGLRNFLAVIEKNKSWLNPNLKILGIVLNLVEGRRSKMADELENALRINYGSLMFKSYLNRGVKLEMSPAYQQSIMEADPKCKVAIQFNAFIDEFLERVKTNE